MLQHLSSYLRGELYLTDRNAALKFFRSLAGSKLLGGPSGTHPDRNMQGGRDARLKAIVSALQEQE